MNPAITRFGDDDCITGGGGVVFETSNGTFFEYVEGDGAEGPLSVFRTQMEDNLCDQFKLSRTDLLDLCESIDEDPITWLADATGTDLQAKANCLIDIGNYLGWDAIDEDPLELDETSLHMRWYAEFNEEGPCATGDTPATVVPDLLKTLHSIRPAAFYEAMDMTLEHYPLVPARPLENPTHPWWTQHGADVLQKIIRLLEGVCPSGFTFEYRNGSYGFWRLPTQESTT